MTPIGVAPQLVVEPGALRRRGTVAVGSAVISYNHQ
jgi:hypothetical protein